MNWTKNGMTLFMLALFVVMVGMATQFPEQSRFMPFVVGIPGILLCLVQLFLDWRAGDRRTPADPVDLRNEFERAQQNISGMTGKPVQFDMAQERLEVVASEVQEGERRRELVLWGALIALVASVILLGFWITIPAFLLLFLRYFARKNWVFSASLAAIGTVVLYLLFQKGLGVILHSGYLTALILELLS